jgi:oligosaccharide repeat unit polymerase
LIYVAFDAVRGHTYHEDVPEYWILLRSNFFGYLPALDQWLHTRDPQRLTFGAYTVAGVFEGLGVFTRERGLYDDLVVLEDGVPTNIYTVFRGLLTDFSLGGALFVCFVGGAIGGRAYRHVIRGQINQFPILAGYYAFFMLSPIISVFNYNATLLALLVSGLVLRLHKNGCDNSSVSLARL